MITKQEKKTLMDILSLSREATKIYEPNEGIDYFFDEMRDFGYSEKAADALFKVNESYLHGYKGARGKIPANWDYKAKVKR